MCQVAGESCSKSLQEELAEVHSDSEDGLSVNFDAGWSKRGNGRSYNSCTGHGVLIGRKTGKVVGYGVKTKACSICGYARRKGISPRAHKCFKNWSGSSKAMEPALAVDMLKEVKTTGHEVKTIIMDNETTMARAKAELGDSLRKRCDRNHTTKSISNSLYGLSTRYKELRNTKTRCYLLRMYTYAIDQCQDRPDDLRVRLQQIVPHVFGDHTLCEASWCGFRKDPHNFAYKSLPYKKPLSDENLKAELVTLTDKLISHVGQVAFLGSSQANESFNNMVAAKAPKNR